MASAKPSQNASTHLGLTYVNLKQVSSPYITGWTNAKGFHTGAPCDEATFNGNRQLSLTRGINPLYVSMMLSTNGVSRVGSFCAQVERVHLHKVLNALTPNMSRDEMDALCLSDFEA